MLPPVNTLSLIKAIEERNFDTFQGVIDQWADINQPEAQECRTPLQLLCKICHKNLDWDLQEMLKFFNYLLVEKKAKVSPELFEFAKFHCPPKIVEFLGFAAKPWSRIKTLRSHCIDSLVQFKEPDLQKLYPHIKAEINDKKSSKLKS